MPPFDVERRHKNLYILYKNIFLLSNLFLKTIDKDDKILYNAVDASKLFFQFFVKEDGGFSAVFTANFHSQNFMNEENIIIQAKEKINAILAEGAEMLQHEKEGIIEAENSENVSARETALIPLGDPYPEEEERPLEFGDAFREKTNGGKRLSKEQKEKEQKIKKIAIGVGIFLLLLLLLKFILLPAIQKARNVDEIPLDETGQQVEETSFQTGVEGMVEKGGMVSVVQATKNIKPGDDITTDCFREAKISAEEYNLMRATGKRACLYEQAAYYIGNYAANYIASGQIFMADDITFINMLEQASNPWETGKTLRFTDNLQDEFKNMTIGDKVTISVIRKVDKDHPQTLWVVYGTVSDVLFRSQWESGSLIEYIEATGTVSDVIMENGSSLYERYNMMKRIPFGDLIKMVPDLFSADAMKPQAVNISFSSDVGNCLDNIDMKDSVISYKTEGREKGKTQEQKDVLAYINFADTVIGSAK